MGLGRTWMIASAIAVSIAAFWLYNRLSPEGVVSKGDEQALAWVTLATAIVSLLTALVGLVEKLAGRRRAPED